MKRFGIALSLLLLLAGPARAQVGIEFGSAIATRYIWRGFDLAGPNDKTIPAFQPTATFAFGDVSVNWWGSLNMAERDASRGFDEFDISIGVSKIPVEGFNIDFGAIYYTFPQAQDGGNKSVEWYMGFSTDKVSFGPGITFYYDTDLANGLYTLISASQPLSTVEKFPLNLDFSLGIGKSYFVEHQDNFLIHDINFGLSTGWGNDVVTFSPSIVYSITPEDAVNTDNGELYGLFSLDFAF